MACKMHKILEQPIRTRAEDGSQINQTFCDEIMTHDYCAPIYKTTIVLILDATATRVWRMRSSLAIFQIGHAPLSFNKVGKTTAQNLG